MDANLARLARSEAQLKLRIGEALDALFELGGHHELGCSSFEAYVVQHCQQSRAWGRKTRALAHRLRERGLVEIRRAILAGRLGTSMAELLARHATHENEVELLEQASRSTVREMRELLTGQAGETPEEKPEELLLRPRRRVTQSELVMLEASRVLVEHLIGRAANDEALMTALLGEGETTLEGLRERNAEDTGLPRVDAAHLEEVAHALREARARRRPRPMKPLAGPIVVEVLADPPLPETIPALHREIVSCCARLATRNLELGRLLAEMFAARGWARLGYESLGHYASERLGLSLSSVEHRLTLARRVNRFPQIRVAIEEGAIGYESALLVSRVFGRTASAELVDAWIERARRRTVKYLREETRAVLVAVQLDPRVSRFPPGEDDLDAVRDLERKIQSGELLRSLSLPAALDPQTSIALDTGDATRVIQLTVSADLYAHWRNLESEFREFAGENESFIAFLVGCLWGTWLPFLEESNDGKWGHIYRRDRHRCCSPICERRDVTPHHLRFRAHGGTDEPENMISLCEFCHLRGIHEGRLRAEGPASNPTWILGRDANLVVAGREKLRG